MRGSEGHFELIAGERRFRAAKLAGLTEVPIQIRDVDDREALELALIENIQREDLNPVEEARGYQQLADEFAMSHDDIALRVGKTRAAVTNSLRLLQLSREILSHIEAGKMSAGHGRSLLAIPAGDERDKAADEIIGRKLNVRDAEKLVRERAQTPQDPDAADRISLESSLGQVLGTKVRIRTSGKKKGRIEIEFYSLDQLDGLVERLAPDSRAAASF